MVAQLKAVRLGGERPRKMRRDSKGGRRLSPQLPE
jgi:hypothetical protein